MELLHGLVFWVHPRKGIFRCDLNQYDAKLGWLDEEKELLIIGEDNLLYITKTFRQDTYLEHPDRPPLRGDLMSGIGPHKSRLVKWVETQLELF